MLYEIRDKIIGTLAVGIVGGLVALGSIAWNVRFLVDELPKILDTLDDRQMLSEAEIKALKIQAGRTITVLERHDERLDKLEKKQ